jgi:uncharacterized protein (TIGR03083 family)
MRTRTRGGDVTVDEPIVSLLVTEWAALDAVLAGLDTEAWAAETCLPGWTVQDIVAHLIGIEAMMAGETAPEPDVDVRALPHVRNDLGAENERWVHALRGERPAVVLERFREIVRTRTEALQSMTADDFDGPSWTPVGPGTYRQFLRIRLFDCWLHEQDIRDAVGRPGHATGPCAEAAVDQMTGSLGFVVGKRAAAPDGSAVTLALTGPVERTVHVVVEGRARVVTSLDREAVTTLEMTSDLFVRLAGGRVTPDQVAVDQVAMDQVAVDQVAVDRLAGDRAAGDRLGSDQPVRIGGDAELGRRVLAALAVTP